MASGAEIRAALADSIETGLSCRYGESDFDVASYVEEAETDLDWCMRGSMYVMCSTFEYNRKPTAKDLPRRHRRRF